MVESRDHCRKAWNCAGLAVELSLKLVILRNERFNAWPTREMRKDLHTHDLRRLMELAGIKTADVPPPLRSALKTVLDWSRGADYIGQRMPRQVARSMVDSALGEGKVIEWLLNRK